MRTFILSLFIFLVALTCAAQQKQRVTASIGLGVSPVDWIEWKMKNNEYEQYRNEYPEGIICGVGYEIPFVRHTFTLEPRFTYGYYKAYPSKDRYYYANVLQVGIIPHYYYDLTEGNGATFLTAEVEFSLANVSGKITDTGSFADFRNSDIYRVFNTTFRTGVQFSFNELDFYPWIGISSLRFREYLNKNLPKNAEHYPAQEALFSFGVTFKFF